MRSYESVKRAIELAEENERLKRLIAETEEKLEIATKQLKWSAAKLIDAQNRIRTLDWLLSAAIESEGGADGHNPR